MEKKANHDDQPAKAESLLTTEQAAWLLRISRKTLARMRVEGRGPKFVKIGRCVRYRQRDLLPGSPPTPTNPHRSFDFLQNVKTSSNCQGPHSA